MTQFFKNTIKNTIKILPLFFLSIPISAATIQDIKIGGSLKKTQTETILHIIQFEKGDDIQSDDIQKIKQNLIKSGLFINEATDVRLVIEDGEADLYLALEERVSIVPIPIFQSSGGMLKGGLFLMDSNVKGSGDHLFLGGLAGYDFKYFSGSYTNTMVSGGPWDLGGALSYSKSETEITDSKGESILSFDSSSLSGDLFTIWHLTPWDIKPIFRFGLMDDYTSSDFVTTGSPNLEVLYSNLYWGDYFSEGLECNLASGMTLFSITFDTSYYASISLGRKKILTERVQISMNTSGQFYSGDIKQSPGISSPLLPTTIRADWSFQTTMGVNIALADFSWGYLAIPFSYSAGIFDGVSGGHEMFHGPSASLTLNLKKIAFPAVALIYGWNAETSEGQISFNIGIH